ncbi:O-antigen ligase family protein [Acinetobacter sp. YH12254]|uniref:O-antigen ligase family protein n=1 Tax=Acinetobacter sp. YH12254 TaxID=2601178 RepID=UPI0015D180D7|nr:O-antigen ligase family protein [Acinetobacter sp. YH12254]
MITIIFYIVIIFFYASFLFGFLPVLYATHYDQARIFGLLIYTYIIMYGFYKNKKNSLNKKIFLYSIVLVVYLLVSIIFHPYFYFSLTEFVMLYLLAYATYIFSTIDFKKKNIDIFLLILCLLPVYNILLFFICVYMSFHTGGLIGWHGWADNYRFFDSMLILPIFLCLYFIAKKNIFSKYFFILYFFYILMLFFDGARSALISIIIPIFLAFFIYTKYRKILSISIIIYFLAFTVHTLYLRFNPLSIGTVFRDTASGRYELWLYGIRRFLEKPLFGHGGANFSLDTQEYLSSPHNLIIQFMSEWGTGGILLIVLLFWLYSYLLKNIKGLSPFIVLCAIAILIDGLFSGLFILPMSQMNFMLVIGLLLNQINQHRVAGIVDPSFNYQFYKYIFSVVALICIGYFLIFHWGDITCLNCMGMEGVNTPRFWRGGKSLHLQEID